MMQSATSKVPGPKLKWPSFVTKIVPHLENLISGAENQRKRNSIDDIVARSRYPGCWLLSLTQRIVRLILQALVASVLSLSHVIRFGVAVCYVERPNQSPEESLIWRLLCSWICLKRTSLSQCYPLSS